MSDSLPPTTVPPLSSNGPGTELVKAMWACFAISTVFVGLRIHTRLAIVKKTAWDDFWILIAQCVNLVAFILNQLAVNSGFGLHAAQLLPQSAIDAIKWAFLGQVFGIMGSALGRMGFIVTLRMILAPNQEIQLWLLRILFFFQVGINTTIALYILLQCRPTYALWDHAAPGSVCLAPHVQESIGFTQGAINSFTDLALAVFPATIIWQLQMKRWVKLALCAAMGLSVFSFVGSIMKTISLTEVNSDPTDLTYIMWGIQFWFCIENCTIVVAATIPVLRPLLSFRRDHEVPPSLPTSQNLFLRTFRRYTGRFTTDVNTDSSRSPFNQHELAHGAAKTLGNRKDHQYWAEAVVDIAGIRRGDDETNTIPPSGILRTVDTHVSSKQVTP